MKIESHNINYETNHEFSLSKSDTFKEELFTLSVTEPVEEEVELKNDAEFIRQIKFALIQKLIQILFGENEESVQLESIYDKSTLAEENTSMQFRSVKKIEVEYQSIFEESERLCMQTEGLIKTEDGRNIEINLDVSMQRSFYSKTTIEKTIFTDPLVINLEGGLPQLESTTFSFDIDCDGTSDQISCLSKNSAFLALDKNENGSIDDGSELFGTQSGDGFADLSFYDEDGNSWIDENDAIFDGLRIWNDDDLLGLGEVGIGAIYLGANDSPYTYKDENNESLGKLRQSSVFLYESGQAGTLSQIDFAKNEVKDPLSEALATV